MAVAAGEKHTCALLDTGGLKCWGKNNSGQLGHGDNADQITPVDVVGLSSGVASLATGGDHTCALLDGGGVKCWGNDFYGQLGDGGDNVDQITPVDVIGLSSGVVAIAAGSNHTCALLDTGGLKCWGDDYYGQLGDGGINAGQNTLVDVVGLASGVAAVAAGTNFSCALFDTGAVKCWGDDYFGQLGDGETNAEQSMPGDVADLQSGVMAVAIGSFHTCALLNPSALQCWGDDHFGQLGNGGAKIDQWKPVDVVDLSSGVTAVAAGGDHTCALLDGGAVKCRGDDSTGQLGDGGANPDQSTPVDVVDLASGVAAVSAGF